MKKGSGSKKGGRRRGSVPRRGNLAGETAGRLREAILRGDYAIGQPLRELELCEKLGVSRNPLREALRQLVGEGLVDPHAHRGAVVASPSKSELEEVAEACRLLEAHFLARACPNLSAEKLGEAEVLVARMDAEDDLLEWARLNWEFHVALYSAARLPFLVRWLGQLRARADLALRVLLEEKERRVALNREHRAILVSVRDGRFRRAQRLLDQHLARAKDVILELL